MAEQMQTALKSRASIDQANGILMAQHGYDPDTASKELVRLSSHVKEGQARSTLSRSPPRHHEQEHLQMPHSPAISDEQVTAVLSAYVGMVDRVLSDPQRWLGMDEDPPPSAAFPARAVDALRDRAFGERTPASLTWHEEPVQKRVSWWVSRIGISAGLAAAAPRFFGALANRLPVQSALGAAAAGLAVCATAREHGKAQPGDWVPLLGTVLFDRDLHPPTAPVPTAEESEQQLVGTPDEAPDPLEEPGGLTDGAKRAATTIWRLARALLALGDLLNHRPRGGRFVRLLAQVPVVGVASGWLDERGGIRKATEETTRLLQLS